MTEAEWLACEDPLAVLTFLQERASSRKLRLFACAFFRHIYPPTDTRMSVVEVGERYAETQATQDEIRAAAARALTIHQGAAQAVWLVVSTNVAQSLRSVFSYEFSLGCNPKQAARFRSPLQEIFGNPSRPIAFDPAWRTSDVMLLAQGIYDERAFDRMPILADALQDAGCDNDTILSHCRDTSLTHVRGCWALDLVLGKE